MLVKKKKKKERGGKESSEREKQRKFVPARWSVGRSVATMAMLAHSSEGLLCFVFDLVAPGFGPAGAENQK